MRNLKASITTLSPVHIGNGNEFDPTSYVVMDDLLLHFFPELVPLYDSEKSNLMAAVNRTGSDAIVGIQSFFANENIAMRCAAVSHQAIGVTKGIADEYRRRVGKRAVSGDGSKAINQLDIKRTANNEHAGGYTIPGSSLKGAIRTAWLNHLLENEPQKKDFVGGIGRNKTLDEKKLLNGSFSSDPFRLLKISDARGRNAAGKIQFSVNRRRVKKEDKVSKGPPQRVETIAEAQNAIFDLDIDLQIFDQQFKSAISKTPADKDRKKSTPDEHRSIPSIKEMFRVCNLYYLKRLKSEIDMLKNNNYVNDVWESSLWSMLAQLEPQLESGEIGLLRVGRYCGAASITVDHMREVMISTGKNKPPAKSAEGGTTIWLAAPDQQESTDMLPFGWVLVEPSDNLNPVVIEWCETNCIDSIDRINTRTELLIADKKDDIEKIRRQIASEKENKLQRESEARTAEEAEEKRKKEASELLSRLTGNEKLIEELRLQLEPLANGSVPAGHEPYPAITALLKAANEGEGWSSDEKKLLADTIEPLVFAKINIGKKAKPRLKKTFKELRGES